MPAPRSDRGRGRAAERRAEDVDARYPTRASVGLRGSDRRDDDHLRAPRPACVVTPTTVRRLFLDNDLPRDLEEEGGAVANAASSLAGRAPQRAVARRRLSPSRRWRSTARPARFASTPCWTTALASCWGSRPITTSARSTCLACSVRALRRNGVPDALYLDNGSTYRGKTLEVACGRLGISLLHAAPYSPQSRGKMERFWRTLREGCVDFLGKKDDASRDQRAFVELRRRALSPATARRTIRANAHGVPFREGETTPVSETHLREALTVRARRRVRGDNTVSVNGRDFQVAQSFLARKLVTVAYCSIDDPIAPLIEQPGTNVSARAGRPGRQRSVAPDARATAQGPQDGLRPQRRAPRARQRPHPRKGE